MHHRYFTKLLKIVKFCSAFILDEDFLLKNFEKAKSLRFGAMLTLIQSQNLNPYVVLINNRFMFQRNQF